MFAVCLDIYTLVLNLFPVLGKTEMDGVPLDTCMYTSATSNVTVWEDSLHLLLHLKYIFADWAQDCDFPRATPSFCLHVYGQTFGSMDLAKNVYTVAIQPVTR